MENEKSSIEFFNFYICEAPFVMLWNSSIKKRGHLLTFSKKYQKLGKINRNQRKVSIHLCGQSDKHAEQTRATQCVSTRCANQHANSSSMNKCYLLKTAIIFWRFWRPRRDYRTCRIVIYRISSNIISQIWPTHDCSCYLLNKAKRLQCTNNSYIR